MVVQFAPQALADDPDFMKFFALCSFPRPPIHTTHPEGYPGGIIPKVFMIIFICLLSIIFLNQKILK